ncbi:bactofilin family protein [Phytohalomonas tamaricis]|uniref:bactofilin family protein n=1 Tax=Phytohalomonas tamaricis TaxID=2081032 RepID=UPI0021D44C6F|nr:polymer-forming cytoskeletal protein [Phytohalomonas tamaricis]
MFSKPKPSNVSDDHVVSPQTMGASSRKDERDIERSVRSMALIGPTTHIEGDIVGEEDLTIEGQVKGIIEFKANTVTIGSKGNVQGDVFAHTLHVSGEVKGRLIASGKVTVHHGARVAGTIISPCLVLEDGSIFHGSVDMDPEHELLSEAFGTTPSASDETQHAAFSSAETAPKDAFLDEEDILQTPSDADHNRLS